MKTNRNIFMLIVLLILSVGSKPPEYMVKIEIVDNIKVITNPDYPRDGIVKYDLVVELFTQNKEQNRIYDEFSADRIYLEQVTVAHRIFDFKDGKIYSIVRTEQDFRVVKRFRLV